MRVVISEMKKYLSGSQLSVAEVKNAADKLGTLSLNLTHFPVKGISAWVNATNNWLNSNLTKITESNPELVLKVAQRIVAFYNTILDSAQKGFSTWSKKEQDTWKTGETIGYLTWVKPLVEKWKAAGIKGA